MFCESHNVGAFVGTLYERKGKVTLYKWIRMTPEFSVRIIDVTRFSVQPNKKSNDELVKVFGSGAELASARVFEGGGAKIEAWFRRHPDFGGNMAAGAPSNETNVADGLTKLAALRGSGALTDKEFTRQKGRLRG